MGVVTDMVGAVAVIAVAAGAVTEIQIRVGYISTAADGAAVVEVFDGTAFGALLLVGEGNGLARFCPGSRTGFLPG